jgi:hypothetical protein
MRRLRNRVVDELALAHSMWTDFLEWYNLGWGYLGIRCKSATRWSQQSTLPSSFAPCCRPLTRYARNHSSTSLFRCASTSSSTNSGRESTSRAKATMPSCVATCRAALLSSRDTKWVMMPVSTRASIRRSCRPQRSAANITRIMCSRSSLISAAGDFYASVGLAFGSRASISVSTATGGRM